MQIRHIYLIFIVALAACSSKKNTNTSKHPLELPPKHNNPPITATQDVVTKPKLSEAVLNLQQRFKKLTVFLNMNTNIGERIDGINAYKEQVRMTIQKFDVNTEAAQQYLNIISESPSRLEEIRRKQQPRNLIHDDIDALHSLSVMSRCGPECSEWVLEFGEASFQKSIATLLSSQEMQLIKTKTFCEQLELEDAEGELYVPIGGENDKLFTSHLNNLVALQKDSEQTIQRLALQLKKECWIAWLSLCIDDCKTIASTFPALSKAFPHMSKTLSTYRKKTRNSLLPHKELVRLLDLIP